MRHFGCSCCPFLQRWPTAQALSPLPSSFLSDWRSIFIQITFSISHQRSTKVTRSEFESFQTKQGINLMNKIQAEKPDVRRWQATRLGNMSRCAMASRWETAVPYATCCSALLALPPLPGSGNTGIRFGGMAWGDMCMRRCAGCCRQPLPSS